MLEEGDFLTPFFRDVHDDAAGTLVTGRVLRTRSPSDCTGSFGIIMLKVPPATIVGVDVSVSGRVLRTRSPSDRTNINPTLVVRCSRSRPPAAPRLPHSWRVSLVGSLGSLSGSRLLLTMSLRSLRSRRNPLDSELVGSDLLVAGLPESGRHSPSGVAWLPAELFPAVPADTPGELELRHLQHRPFVA